MSKWCQLVGNKVTQIISFNPKGYWPDGYHISCPDEAEDGDAIVNGTLYKRPGYAVAFDEETMTWIVPEERFEEHLQILKVAKIYVIDNKTQELIYKHGFTFDDHQFSMSDKAQANWQALGTAQALGMIPFPYPIATKDEGEYRLQDATALLSFLGTYMMYQADPTQPLGSGRALKARVSAATTIEELDEIVDDRE